jgi:hypothetical protein
MKKILFFAVASMSLTSCATIFSGTSEKISFTSEPAGAKVFYKGLEKCTTPCVTQFNKSLSSVDVEYRHPNFPSKSVNLPREFNATTILNVLVGGIIGIGIDAATGSMMNYTDNSFFVDFNKDTMASQKISKDKIKVAAAENATPSSAPSTSSASFQ